MEKDFEDMPKIKTPEYLYQYTSIETLALILRGKQIKFNSLQNVDDLEESEAVDIKDFGKFTFVSCWTYDDKENIALWNMYTNNMKGVRIGLPYDCIKEDTDYIMKQLKEYKLDLINYQRKSSNEDEYKNDDNMRNYQLREIEYTDEGYKLKPKILSEGNLILNPIKLGEHKRTQWEFQKEYRYVIHTCPIDMYEGDIKKVKTLEEYNAEKERTIKCLEEYNNIPQALFLNIDEKAFEKIEILLGPNTTEADKIIVESLVEKYNPNAKLSDSSLKNKVRNKS